jgi:hypothetical protein
MPRNPSLNTQKIINSTVNDVLAEIPPHGYFQQVYWEGSDGIHKGIVMISGDEACQLMREATFFISDSPIEGPGGEEVLIDRKGKVAAILRELNEARNLPPEHEDVSIIMACLEDVVQSWDDLIQLNDSSETMAASLSSRRSKSAAHVLASLLRLLVNSGISLREVVQYMDQREINEGPMTKLRAALESLS